MSFVMEISLLLRPFWLHFPVLVSVHQHLLYPVHLIGIYIYKIFLIGVGNTHFILIAVSDVELQEHLPQSLNAYNK
jgi:hypothetical protein